MLAPPGLLDDAVLLLLLLLLCRNETEVDVNLEFDRLRYISLDFISCMEFLEVVAEHDAD